MNSKSSQDTTNSTSNTSQSMINQVLSQLGISFVKDRSTCNLSPCGIPVCHSSFNDPRGVVEAKPRSDRKRRIRTASIDGDEVCAVCQDKATGCHYGATTCDSCKDFFEQSVRCRLIYDCHFKRACDLRLQRRNHCQGCRWDKCLEVGMIASAVCKSRSPHESRSVTEFKRRSQRWSRQETEDLLRMPELSSSMTTPQPSLPSPTDTESSHWDSGDDEADRRLAQDLLGGRPCPELPISADNVRNALTPLDSPETIGARLTDLERSCLVDLFRWNKRRLEFSSGDSFGAAAANWTSILLASAARCYLASSAVVAGGATEETAATSGESLTAELTARLQWLLRGREFEFEPLLDKLGCLMTHIGGLCSQLLEIVLELKRDVLSDIILMMGDQTEEELSFSLQNGSSTVDQPRHLRQASPMLRVLRLLVSASDLLRSARPEQRALLLAALVSDAPVSGGSGGGLSGQDLPSKVALAAPDNSLATCCTLISNPEEECGRVPVLFGL